MGAVGIIPWRSLIHGSTARKKVPQLATLTVMRAMRSLLCDVLRARLTPLSSPQFSRIV
jgi:hypothetical protein